MKHGNGAEDIYSEKRRSDIDNFPSWMSLLLYETLDWGKKLIRSKYDMMSVKSTCSINWQGILDRYIRRLLDGF